MRKNRFPENLFRPGFSTLKPVLYYVTYLFVMVEAASSKAPRAVWDMDRDTLLVALLQAQADMGKRADTGFKKEAWTAVAKQFNDRLGLDYEREQLKARLKQVECIIFKLKK